MKGGGGKIIGLLPQRRGGAEEAKAQQVGNIGQWARKRPKISIGFWLAAVVYAASAFLGSGWGRVNGSTNFNGFKILCHSIEVCARLPRWAANEMCSSVLKEWMF